MTVGSLVFSLPQFEGPLDLLLALVRRNGVEITDIPIADITRQYLEYLEEAEQLDLGLASEFAYMAATLIQIKARCLLPADPELLKRDGDPRQEVVRLLMDHEQVRQAAQFLGDRLDDQQATQVRNVSVIEYQDSESNAFTPDDAQNLNLLEILRLTRKALDVAQTYSLVTPRESVTVEEMLDWLEQRLGDCAQRLDGLALLAELGSIEHKIALFLALLELNRVSRIQLDQGEALGPLSVTSVP